MLAARAAASFVLANESNTALLKHFADLLPGILQVGPSPPGPVGFIHSCVDNARLNYNQQQHVSHHIIMLDMLNLSCFLIKLHCDSDIEWQRLSTLVFLLLMDNFCNINPDLFVLEQAVHDSCYQGDDSVLKSLVEIADTAPKYLRPNLEATLQLCLKVSQ